MAKILVKFITLILELAAFLFVLIGAFLGWSYGQEQQLQLLLVVLGAAAGFVSAAIVLGIPLIVVRINQNLDQINEKL